MSKRYLPEKWYGKKFFRKRLQHRAWQNSFGFYLAKRYGYNSITDLGCGLGWMMEGARRLAVTTLGYERKLENVLLYLPKDQHCYIREGSVTEDLDLSETDAVCCIEVAEHIPEKASSCLVDNCVKAAQDLIIFSAASPEQAGTGHINCQPPEYWHDLFRQREWFFQQKETESLRKGIKLIARYPSFIRKNIMIFKKETEEVNISLYDTRKVLEEVRLIADD